MSLFLLLAALYNPQHWQFYPAVDTICSVTIGLHHIYVAVPRGVYLLDRSTLRYRRALTAADGLEGDVKFCGFVPGRNLLYICTTNRLYEYLPATDILRELSPPFQTINSLGVTPDVAWFDTDNGLFRRTRSAPQFERVQTLPASITWYGLRDTISPRSFPILTPWYVVDEQLERHELTHVWPDPRGRRLLAAARGYGLVVFNAQSGFPVRHFRAGPSGGNIQKAFHLDGRMWFAANDRVTVIDSTGDWRYFLTTPGHLVRPGFRLLLPALTALHRSEELTSLLPDSLGLILGTNRGLYRLNSANMLLPLVQLPQGVNAILRARDTLLVGTDDGLLLLAGDSLTYVTDPFARFDWGVFGIGQTDNGDLFFATQGGIVHLTPTDTWTRLVPPGHDLSQSVNSVAVGRDYLFYSTGSAVGAYNWRHGTWHEVTTGNNRPWSRVHALCVEGDFLWLVCPDIICRYKYGAGLQ